MHVGDHDAGWQLVTGVRRGSPETQQLPAPPAEFVLLRFCHSQPRLPDCRQGSAGRHSCELPRTSAPLANHRCCQVSPG